LLGYLDRFAESTTDASLAADVFCPGGTCLLAAALAVVFVGELGLIPADVALGAAALLSVGGAAAVVYGARY